MSEQAPLKKLAVVGEDGELLQPDMTVDPDAYAEFVATHVRRDPLRVRMREHVKEWGCVYLFFAPWILLVIFGTVLYLFSNRQDDVAASLIGLNISLFIITILAIGVIYIIIKISQFVRRD